MGCNISNVLVGTWMQAHMHMNRLFKASEEAAFCLHSQFSELSY